MLSPTSGSTSGKAAKLPSLSSLSQSGGEASASASSSRSHLPLQSKASLYRQQASSSSHSCNNNNINNINNNNSNNGNNNSSEASDDGYLYSHGRGGSDNLSRAKSVSSVSSVNSTSSMEAAPFRAAPLGNVRPGFGGLSRRRQMGLSRSRGGTVVAHQHANPPSPSPVPVNNAASRTARTRSDFHFGDVIGEGSYSTVIEAWDLLPLREKGISVPAQSEVEASNAMAAIAGKSSKRFVKASLEGAKVYAVKILDKAHILKEKKQKYVNVEKEALSLLTRHPGVITLYWTFQDRDSLYFVLEMASNGELLSSIKKLGSFSDRCACYYAAQLVDTLDAIHRAGVLHRDIKPENVLLDADMRIRLADFGSAKILSNSVPRVPLSQDKSAARTQRPSSFVGTAEYVSPELLIDKQVSEASDYWALGCILFQMLYGRPPFKGASEYQTFQKIMRRDFEFQDGISASAKDLLDRLLALNPADRPTSEQLRAHTFFSGTAWSQIWTCDAPGLEAGIHRRPTPATIPQGTTMSSQETFSSRISDDAEDEVDEDLRSDFESLHSTSAPDRSVAPCAMNHVDDEDDDSSESDSQRASSFRKRGFSAGASAAERMLAQVSSSTRKGGNNLFNKVTAGFASFDRSESSFNSPSSRGYLSSIGNRASGSARNPAHAVSGREAGMGATPDEKFASMATEDRLNAPLATGWAALLLPHESLLYACPVLQRVTGQLLRNSVKKRQLLLTDFPRLLCVKETNDQLKVKSEVLLRPPIIVSPSVTDTTPNSLDCSSAIGRPQSRGAPTDASRPPSSNKSGNGEGVRLSAPEQTHSASQVLRASQMRRQNSAGPLMPSSPASSEDFSISSFDMARGLSSGGRRRESSQSVLTRQQQLLIQQQTNGIISTTSDGTRLRVSMPPVGTFPRATSLTPTPSAHARSNPFWATSIAGNNPSEHSSSTLTVFMDAAQASPNVMTSIESKSCRSFAVHTPARSYLYDDPAGDASHWIDSITMAARSHAAAAVPPSTPAAEAI